MRGVNGGGELVRERIEWRQLRQRRVELRQIDLAPESGAGPLGSVEGGEGRERIEPGGVDGGEPLHGARGALEATLRRHAQLRERQRDGAAPRRTEPGAQPGRRPSLATSGRVAGEE